MPIQTTPARVAVVIVTYGKRRPLLQQILQGLQHAATVKHIVIVDNAAEPPVKNWVHEVDLQAEVHLVTLTRNHGSAGGYADGIERARRLDVDYLFLLDDDLVLSTNCIDALLQLHVLLGESDDIVLCALRSGRHEYERLLACTTQHQILPNSFLGFHVAELGNKLWSRMRRTAPQHHVLPSRIRHLEVAPYGGLLMPIACAYKVELPRRDFVLYGDDHEYTYRMSEAGIKILLTDIVVLHDADLSWNTQVTVNPWINPDVPPWRVYFACRNRMLVERAFTSSSWIYHLNLAVYLVMLLMMAIRVHSLTMGTLRSLRPLRDAIKDANANRTGERAGYALPHAALPESSE